MVKSTSGISITENAAQLVNQIAKKKTQVTVAFLKITGDLNFLNEVSFVFKSTKQIPNFFLIKQANMKL